MRNAIFATSAALGVLALATAASAQDAAGSGRKVNVEVQLKALYDSNVARSSQAVADARGIDRSDTIITPSLNADILLPVSRQSVFLRGSIGHDYYQKNDILSAGRYDLDGGANLKVGICQGQASIGYRESQSDLQDFGLVATKNIQQENIYGADITCGRTAGFAPTASIKHTKAENSASTLLNSDFDTTNYMFGLAYRRPSFGVLTLFGSYEDTEYPNRLVPSGGSGLVKDGYQSQSIGLRYERRLGARIGGEVEVAYTTLDPELFTLDKANGATYKANIDFRASSRLTTSLQLQRAVEPTILPGASYSVNQNAQLTAVYGVGSRIKLSGGISFDDVRYHGISIPGQISKESIDAIFGAVRWDVGRRVALLGDIRHEERDANVAGFDYSSTQVGVSVIGKF